MSEKAKAADACGAAKIGLQPASTGGHPARHTLAPQAAMFPGADDDAAARNNRSFAISVLSGFIVSFPAEPRWAGETGGRAGKAPSARCRPSSRPPCPEVLSKGVGAIVGVQLGVALAARGVLRAATVQPRAFRTSPWAPRSWSHRPQSVGCPPAAVRPSVALTNRRLEQRCGSSPTGWRSALPKTTRFLQP